MANSSFVEQMAQLRALGERVSLPSRFPVHPVHGVLERTFLCLECLRVILVGPCFDHLDAEEFICGECLAASGDVETLNVAGIDTASTTASGGAGTAGNSQGMGL